MRPCPEYRAEVSTPGLVDQLATAPLPLGLGAGPAQMTFHRDIYFDATDWALRRRGVSCRFRIRFDDRRVLTLRVQGAVDRDNVPQSEVFEADVPDLDGVQALTGTSEPARRLRALIDLERLGPRLALETERRVRRSRRSVLAVAEFEFHYDLVTVAAGGLAGTFQEVKIRQLRSGWPAFRRLVTRFEAQYGLRSLLVGKLERGERLLRSLESEALARGVTDSREVAVLVVEQGSVALRHERGVLTVPVELGSGEAACRHVLRTCFGSGDAQVRLLATAPTAPNQPLLEVWLARRPGRGLDAVAGTGLEWVAFEEVVARVGLPGLRDPRTLAALAVASRSELVSEWPSTFVSDLGHEPSGRVPRPPRVPGGRRPSVVEESAIEHAAHFLNSELSWLEFSARVLELAEDRTLPLLARVRFLGILRSNLDEFFMVRVASLKRAVATRGRDASDTDLTPGAQLDAITIRVRSLLDRLARCQAELCLRELPAHGIRIRRWSELDEAERSSLRRVFTEQIFPLLTPQAITRAPGHPFPFLPNLRVALAVVVRDAELGAEHFVYLKLPEGVAHLVPVSDGGYVPLEEVVRANVDAVYGRLEVEGAYLFRATRSGDIELDDEHAENLLQVIEEEAQRRPYGFVVRIETERGMPPAVQRLIRRELEFEHADRGTTLPSVDYVEVDVVMDPQVLEEVADLPRPDLQYPPFRGRPMLEDAPSVFSVLRDRDILVHHPYDAFGDTVERFFLEAADDPDVAAIKLTLYRAGGRSAIVDALIRASQDGKEVFAFVELKARFDEARNITWARKLEEAGARVVYGLVGLKTHAKIALVVRREGGGIRRYAHIGTGNYNAATAALYADLGLLTSDPVLTSELNDLFNELSGSSRPPATAFRQLLVAPGQMLVRFIELIDREAAHARAGREARIRAQMNGLADPAVIRALYRASQAGVDIDLVVRGLCCLRPGVPGVSDRIRVTSIVGRFLEHARIFSFANGGEPESFIGSADWRSRNLRRRIEVVAPVRDRQCRARLDQVLETALRDPTAWELDPDGSYSRRAPTPGQDPRSAQDQLMDLVGEGRETQSAAPH